MELVKYKASDGTSVELDKEKVQKFLLTGNGNVTDAEAARFCGVCQANGMNPFRGDVYLIKYSDKQPASCVTSVEYFERVASTNADYDGLESGVIVQNLKGEVVKREGAVVVPGEKLIGAWCKVYRKSRTHPTFVSATYGEMVQTKRDYDSGRETPNHNWSKMPAWMCVKTVKSRGLREAFPERFEGLFTKDEMPDPIESKPVIEPAVDSSQDDTDVNVQEVVEPTVEDSEPAEITTGLKEFMRGATETYAKAMNIDPSLAARKIMDACGDPREHGNDSGYLNTVMKFVNGKQTD